VLFSGFFVVFWQEYIALPMFIRGMAETVKAKIRHFGAERIRPGDIYVTNDSYLTGSHLNHVTLTLPIFHAGELVAFSCCMAHWLDIGGILGGVFTAIEAGAVACVWAFFVTMFIYRDYAWRDLPKLLHRTLKTVTMVMTLIAFAASVGYVMAMTQMPAKITALFLSISDNKYVILFLINVMLLILGCLVDMAPSILICTPILLPVMINFGVDPVHFGMIMMLNLGIGLCHPPVGSILFVGCAVGKVTIEQVMRTIWPFYAVMFAVLMLVTYIPALSLWLPVAMKLN